MKYPSEPRWLLETHRAINEWRTVVLMVLHGKERRHFWLSHNGARFAKGGEFDALALKFPGLLEQVAEYFEAPYVQ